MKMKSILSAALMLCGTAFAQSGEKQQTKKLQMPAFEKLTVDARIDVVLIDDDQPGIVYLVGDEKLFGDISFKSQKDELSISGKNDVNYKSKLTVEVHVKDLKKVSLQREAMVFSGNTLKSKKIDVAIREGSKASIVSTGNITITSEEDAELVFLRKTPGVSVVNK